MGINEQFFEFYSERSNYNLVYDGVEQWFAPQNGGSATHNGCAAFCSTALQHVVPTMPHEMMAQGLADVLLKRGWKKVTDPKLVKPGMIIVTEDNPEYPGYAAHIFMIASEIDVHGYGVAIDNQAFKYRRNISVAGAKTPWHYALKCPV
jgi:hypothetical protein